MSIRSTRSTLANEIIKKFPNIQYNLSKAEFNIWKKNQNGTHLAYAVLANSNMVIIGQGKPDRANFLFKGYKPKGHIKAFTMAMIDKLYEYEILILPAKDEPEALALEDELKAMANFHDNTNLYKNSELFNLCLQQYGIVNKCLTSDGWINSIIEDDLLQPTGCEMGAFNRKIHTTYKKHMTDYQYNMLQCIINATMSHWFDLTDKESK
jgi:hypothetical protein